MKSRICSLEFEIWNLKSEVAPIFLLLGCQRGGARYPTPPAQTHASSITAGAAAFTFNGAVSVTVTVSAMVVAFIGELIQQGVFQLDGRLKGARELLLAQQVGDVIGPEGAGARGLGDGPGNGLRSVEADELEQLSELTAQRAITVWPAAQVSEQGVLGQRAGEQALLGLGASGGGRLNQQLFVEALGD